MAHLRLHLLSSDSDPDDFPFGPNSPVSASKSDPPPSDPPGPPFGPNCVGCISTQNLANGAVTTPKIAPGAVSTTTQEVASGITFIDPTAPNGNATVQCPTGTVVTGGGFHLKTL